jgi:hypothetical protein
MVRHSLLYPVLEPELLRHHRPQNLLDMEHHRHRRLLLHRLRAAIARYV